MRTLASVGFTLARRRAVTAVAIAAAVICGLGSCVMQELAHSQRGSYDDQTALAGRLAAECRGAQPGAEAACLESRGAPTVQSLEAFRGQTDALGARSRSLQSVGGALNWTQTFLLTLLGVATLIVAVAATTAADVEAGRLMPGWHPRRASHGPFVVALTAGVAAAATVALGALGGSVAAAVVGRVMWPLGGEPAQAGVPELGAVALYHPSVGGLLAILSVALVAAVVSWFAGRTLVAVLACGLLFGVLALLTDVLPTWFPGASLPASAGMWFHHRGEITHLWIWPVKPLENGAPSLDWTALRPGDPGLRPLVGVAATFAALAIAAPRAVRRRPS